MDNCKCPEPSSCEYCSRMYPCDCHGCPHKICGAIPYCGSWNAWCELLAGHDGMHVGDAGAFRLASRKRHISGGKVVSGPPPSKPAVERRLRPVGVRRG